MHNATLHAQSHVIVLRQIYTVWFLSHATSLQHLYEKKKSHTMLKHVLKPYDNHGLRRTFNKLVTRKIYK